MENDAPDAAYAPSQALADVSTAREAAADRLVTPWWYHPVLSANLAFLTLLIALRPGHPLFFVGCSLSILISTGLISAYKKVTGVWITPRECGPRSRRLWAAYAVVIALAVIAAFVLAEVATTAAWVVAALVFALSWVIGRRLDTVLRDEIRCGQATLGRR